MTASQTNNTTFNLTVNRRARLRVLLGGFVQEQVAAGLPPKGLEQSFAAKLQISPSMLSQIKSSRPIGDTLARQIERACEVALGWMDESDGETLEPTIAEEAFVALARSAWRQANAKQKRELTHFFKASRA
jgi:hypothetical protein